MEKISGILPSRPRTQVADISTAQPARPGALALGRPEGKNSLGDRISMSKRMDEMMQQGQLPDAEAPATYKPTAEMRKLKVIEDLNQKFFSNPKTTARDSDLTKAEETYGQMAQNESLFTVEEQLQPKSLDPQVNKGDMPL